MARFKYLEEETDLKTKPWTWLSVLAFGLAGFFLVIWQTTVQIWLIPGGYGPNFVVVLVFYAGLSAPLSAGAAMAAILGFLLDTAGGGIFGLSAMVYLAVFFTGWFMRQKLDPGTPWYLIAFVLGVSLGATGLIWVALYVFDWPFVLRRPTWQSPVSAAVTSAVISALLSPILFGFFNWLRLRLEAPTGVDG
jgi:rod shape-determining protein MreD